MRPLCFDAHYQEILRRSKIKTRAPDKKKIKEIFLALLGANARSWQKKLLFTTQGILKLASCNIFTYITYFISLCFSSYTDAKICVWVFMWHLNGQFCCYLPEHHFLKNSTPRCRIIGFNGHPLPSIGSLIGGFTIYIYITYIFSSVIQVSHSKYNKIFRRF